MSHNSHHQSRRNYAANSPSVPHQNNVALASSSSSVNQHESVDSRPVTRSVTKRNLQHQNGETTPIVNNASGAIDAGLLPLTSSNHDMNNNNEKILKLIEMRQQTQPKQPLPPQKTFQKIIVNERPCNLISILERSRMGGPTIRNTINVIALKERNYSECFSKFLFIFIKDA